MYKNFFNVPHKISVGRTTHEYLSIRTSKRMHISALITKNIMGPIIRDGWIKSTS